MVKTELLLITFFSDKMIKEKLIIISLERQVPLSLSRAWSVKVLRAREKRGLYGRPDAEKRALVFIPAFHY